MAEFERDGFSRPPARCARPDNELSGPPELHRRTECDGYLGDDHALTSAATRYDGYLGGLS